MCLFHFISPTRWGSNVRRSFHSSVLFRHDIFDILLENGLHRWLPSPLSVNRRCTWCCPFSGPTSASPHRNRLNDTWLKYVDFFCGPHWKPAVVASSTTCASKRDVFRLHDLPSSHTTNHIPCHIPSIPSTETHSYSHHGPPITYQMLSIILNSHSVFMPRELLNESTPIVLLCPFRLPAGPPFTEWNEVKRWWNGAASGGFRKLSRTGAKHLCICRTCHRAVRARWCRSCMSAEVTSWTTSRPQLWRDMDWGSCETARTGSTNVTDDAHNSEDTLGFMKIMKVLQVLAWVIEWVSDQEGACLCAAKTDAKHQDHEGYCRISHFTHKTGKCSADDQFIWGSSDLEQETLLCYTERRKSYSKVSKAKQ